jgi:hypothetical protein
LGFGIYAESSSNAIFFSAYENMLHPAFSFNGGFLFRNPDESLLVDVQVGYFTGKIALVNPDTITVEREIGMPLFVEGTLTITFNQKQTFIIMKQLNDICFARIYYYGRIVPAIEHFFTKWFSARLGAEFAYARLNDTNNFGYAGIGGLTCRLIDFGIDIDLNASYRSRPSRIIEGFLYPEWVVTFNISFNDLFVSWRK